MKAWDNDGWPCGSEGRDTLEGKQRRYDCSDRLRENKRGRGDKERGRVRRRKRREREKGEREGRERERERKRERERDIHRERESLCLMRNGKECPRRSVQYSINKQFTQSIEYSINCVHRQTNLAQLVK